jgi:hypothetical protein
MFFLPDSSAFRYLEINITRAVKSGAHVFYCQVALGDHPMANQHTFSPLYAVPEPKFQERCHLHHIDLFPF